MPGSSNTSQSSHTWVSRTRRIGCALCRSVPMPDVIPVAATMTAMTLPVEFLAPITREAINALPIRRYEGEVRLVATREDIERAAADFATESVVGFDTETQHTIRGGQHTAPALTAEA